MEGMYPAARRKAMERLDAVAAPQKRTVLVVQVNHSTKKTWLDETTSLEVSTLDVVNS
jgi:hypothetical protein